ncbi:FAD-dependent oxidoreductase [Paenibacillus campi]|uniref:NAD(P)/FAD-dependent oxidoreductase n=1 Tax=Paenibacillus campi TaxID=3106031 RepID=UPI002AFE6AC7|nr:FAD-dependent oxidoreductase [Paenibacillus sp. SGZ-1014]
MKLHTRDTMWGHTMPRTPVYEQLKDDLECDVLVIGGGMGGALCAREFAKRGLRTIVAEKRKVGQGSSIANTGLLQYTNDKTLTACINTFGEDNGVLFYRLCRDAMEYLLHTAPQLPIPVQMIPRSSLYFASSPEDVPGLQEEYENLKRHGFAADYWDEAQIAKHFSFSKAGGIYTHGDAEVNPYRLVHGLMMDACRHGARVFEDAAVTGQTFTEQGVIHYVGEHKIRAQKVVFSTGYETQEIKKDRGAFMMSTYAIATTPISNWDGWHNRSMLWETARPYLYIRTTADNRIIAGGLDEPLTSIENMEVRKINQAQRLLAAVEQLFPRLGSLSIDSAWAAPFGSSRDGLPYMGAHPDYPQCYFVEGYGGNGTVYSAIAAMLLADELTGITRPELELFSLTRSAKPSPANAPEIEIKDITA